MTKLIDRVTERMGALGLNPHQAALAAGLKQDYVRDILRGKIKDPSALRLSQLAVVLQCDPQYLNGLRDQLGKPPEKPGAFESRVSLRVSYNLRAGIYVEQDEEAPEPELTFSVFNTFSHADQSQWLEFVADDHADRYVPKGYYVHVVAVDEIEGFKPTMEDLLVVERYREGGALVERTLRKIEGWTFKPFHELHFVSHNARWRTAIQIPEETIESPEAKIVGKVVFAYGGLAREPWR